MMQSRCTKQIGMSLLFLVPFTLVLFTAKTTRAFTPSALTLRSQPQICDIIGCSASTPTRISLTQHRDGKTTGLFIDKQVKNFQQRSSPCLYMSSASSTQSVTSTTATSIATASTKARQFAYKKRVAIIMAFMTGWADFIFIKKYNFFPTMMSGNSLKMSYALVDGRIRDTFFFLTIIFSYMVGVGIFRRAELSYKDKALNGLFAPLVTICFLVSDYLSWVNPSSKFVPAMLLSLAWGVINSVGSEVTGTLIFVVTGAMVSSMKNEV